MLARKAVLLGSGVEDEVTGERRNDKKHGVRAGEGTIIGNEELDMAARNDQH